MSVTEKAQHTPGPWKVDETGEFIETEQPVNLRGEYEHICDFRKPYHLANARLIAAAPELLAALRRFLTAEREQSEGIRSQAAAMARVAIAQVEGTP